MYLKNNNQPNNNPQFRGNVPPVNNYSGDFYGKESYGSFDIPLRSQGNSNLFGGPQNYNSSFVNSQEDTNQFGASQAVYGTPQGMYNQHIAPQGMPQAVYGAPQGMYNPQVAQEVNSFSAPQGMYNPQEVNSFSAPQKVNTFSMPQDVYSSLSSPQKDNMSFAGPQDRSSFDGAHGCWDSKKPWENDCDHHFDHRCDHFDNKCKPSWNCHIQPCVCCKFQKPCCFCKPFCCLRKPICRPLFCLCCKRHIC